MLYAIYYGVDTKTAYRELVDIYHGSAIKIRKRKEAPVVKIVPEEPLAPIKQRNTVYTQFLDMLTLDAAHLKNLKDRGLPEAVIQYNMYRSYPTNPKKRWAICEYLEKKYDLYGVPGFYINKAGKWDFVNYPSGILIPVRDINRNIQGLQLRIYPYNKEKHDCKFLWVSSLGKEKGTGARAFIHYAYPKDTTTVEDAAWWLTEGALKADIAHFYLGVPFIAVPGVTAFYKLMPELKEHGITKLINAYDADCQTNIKVKEALDKLTNELKIRKISFKNANWPTRIVGDEIVPKGIDDACKEKVEQTLDVSPDDFVSVKRKITYERITVEEEIQYRNRTEQSKHETINVTPATEENSNTAQNKEKPSKMSGFFRNLLKGLNKK